MYPPTFNKEPKEKTQAGLSKQHHTFSTCGLHLRLIPLEIICKLACLGNAILPARGHAILLQTLRVTRPGVKPALFPTVRSGFFFPAQNPSGHQRQDFLILSFAEKLTPTTAATHNQLFLGSPENVISRVPLPQPGHEPALKSRAPSEKLRSSLRCSTFLYDGSH